MKSTYVKDISIVCHTHLYYDQSDINKVSILCRLSWFKLLSPSSAILLLTLKDESTIFDCNSLFGTFGACNSKTKHLDHCS